MGFHGVGVNGAIPVTVQVYGFMFTTARCKDSTILFLDEPLGVVIK
jgi:hypothetical protein